MKVIKATVEDLEKFIWIIDPLMTAPLGMQNTITLNNIYTAITKSLVDIWWVKYKSEYIRNQKTPWLVWENDRDIEAKLVEMYGQIVEVSIKESINPYWTYIEVELEYNYELQSVLNAQQYWSFVQLFGDWFFAAPKHINNKELSSSLQEMLKHFKWFLDTINYVANQ